MFYAKKGKFSTKKKKPQTFTFLDQEKASNSVFHLTENEATEEAKLQLQKMSQGINEIGDLELEESFSRGWTQQKKNWMKTISKKEQYSTKELQNAMKNKDINQTKPNLSKTMFGYYRSQRVKSQNCKKSSEFQSKGKSTQVMVKNQKKEKSGLYSPSQKTLEIKDFKANREIKKYTPRNQTKKKVINQIVTVIPELIQKRLKNNATITIKQNSSENPPNNRIKSCILNTTYLQIPHKKVKKHIKNSKNAMYYEKSLSSVFVARKQEQDKSWILNKERRAQEQRILLRFRSQQNEGKLRSMYGEKSKLKLKQKQQKYQELIASIKEKQKMIKIKNRPNLNQENHQQLEEKEIEKDKNIRLKNQFQKLRKLLKKETYHFQQLGMDSPIKIRQL